MTRFMLFSVALTAALAQAALATPINVPNGSFESPVTSKYVNVDQQSDWTWNDNNIYIIKNSGPTVFVAGGGKGLQSLFLEPWVVPASLQYVSQTLTSTLGVGAYTLRVATGYGTGFANGGYDADAVFKLGSYNGTTYTELATSTVLASTLDNTPGTLSDYTLALNVLAGNSHLGENIVVRLGGIGGSNQNVTYDNVRLDYVGVAEPSTLILVATVLIGLLAYAWRKRR